jgi:hypothetical protein
LRQTRKTYRVMVNEGLSHALLASDRQREASAPAEASPLTGESCTTGWAQPARMSTPIGKVSSFHRFIAERFLCAIAYMTLTILYRHPGAEQERVLIAPRELVTEIATELEASGFVVEKITAHARTAATGHPAYSAKGLR